MSRPFYLFFALLIVVTFQTSLQAEVPDFASLDKAEIRSGQFIFELTKDSKFAIKVHLFATEDEASRVCKAMGKFQTDEWQRFFQPELEALQRCTTFAAAYEAGMDYDNPGEGWMVLPTDPTSFARDVTPEVADEGRAILYGLEHIVRDYGSNERKPIKRTPKAYYGLCCNVRVGRALFSTKTRLACKRIDGVGKSFSASVSKCTAHGPALSQLAYELSHKLFSSRHNGLPLSKQPLDKVISQLATQRNDKEKSYLLRKADSEVKSWQKEEPPKGGPRIVSLWQSAAKANNVCALNGAANGARWADKCGFPKPSRDTRKKLADSCRWLLWRHLVSVLADRVAKEGLSQGQRDAVVTALIQSYDECRRKEYELLERSVEMDRLFTALAFAPRLRDGHWINRLEVSVNPDLVPLDGDRKLTLHLHAFQYRRLDASKRRPLAGVGFNYEVPSRSGRVDNGFGKTDGNGQMTALYVPTCDVPEGGPYDEVIVTNEKLGIKEKVYITYNLGKARVDVRPPLLNKPWCDWGIMPADPRFPATIMAYVTDRKDNVIKGAAVEFSCPQASGVLFVDEKGTTSPDKIEVKADEKGEATVKLRYAKAEQLTKAKLVTIHIAAYRPETEEKKALRLKKKRRRSSFWRGQARVSIGIDLAIESVQPKFKGRLSAGEEVPLEISVYDMLHPGIKNLSPIFSHWQESKNQQRLFMHLETKADGTLSPYLCEQLALKNRLPFKIKELAWPVYDKQRGKSFLNISLTGGPGLPRVKLAGAGDNLFDIKVKQATVNVSAGKRSVEIIEEAFDKGNRGYVAIPADIKPSALHLWFVNNPFKATTKEARYLRFIAGLHPLGNAVMLISDSINAINRGDFNELATIAAGQFRAKFTKKFAPSVAEDFATLSTIESFLSTVAPDKVTFFGVVDRSLVRAVQLGASSSHKKVIILKGGELTDKETGQTIPARADALSSSSDKKVQSLRRGNETIYVMPRDYLVEAKGGQMVEYQ